MQKRRVTPVLPLRSLNHISRVVHDVQRSLAFYKDVLGFVEIRRPGTFDFDGAWLFNFQTQLGVHLLAGAPPARPSTICTRDDHLSFQSDNLEVVEERLLQLGVSYVKDFVAEGGIIVTQIFFHDPDHHLIEVCNCDVFPIQPLMDGLDAAGLTKSKRSPMYAEQHSHCCVSVGGSLPAPM